MSVFILKDGFKTQHLTIISQVKGQVEKTVLFGFRISFHLIIKWMLIEFFRGMSKHQCPALRTNLQWIAARGHCFFWSVVETGEMRICPAHFILLSNQWGRCFVVVRALSGTEQLRRRLSAKIQHNKVHFEHFEPYLSYFGNGFHSTFLHK